jgi:hypothetical protein
MEERKKFDRAAAEQEYQKKLQGIKNTLARYTTTADMDSFFKRNASAIEGLARGGAVSDVMTGFRKRTKPNETYDARVELQYYKNSVGELAFTPHFHFKHEALVISPTWTLPTAAREEYSFDLNQCKQNKLEATVNIGGEEVKLALNESDLMELSATKQLSRLIQGSSSRYEYSILAKSDLVNRMNRLIIIQKEKIQISDSDVQLLKQSGHMDKAVKVGEGVNERKYFVAVDRELNKLAFAPAVAFGFLGMVKVVSLSPPDMLALQAGKQVATKLMKGENAGTEVLVRLDPVRKNLKIEAVASSQHQQTQVEKAAHKAAMSNTLKGAIKTIKTATQAPSKVNKMGV